jgi:hypothetical protein
VYISTPHGQAHKLLTLLFIILMLLFSVCVGPWRDLVMLSPYEAALVFTN